MNDLFSISNSDTLQRQLPEFPPFPSKFFILSWIFANICLAQRTNLSSNFFLTSTSYRSKLLQLRKQIFWCLQLSFDVPPNFSSFLHVALNLWSISSVIILSIEVIVELGQSLALSWLCSDLFALLHQTARPSQIPGLVEDPWLTVDGQKNIFRIEEMFTYKLNIKSLQTLDL